MNKEEKFKKKLMKKKEKGITLIALVITIVVILILAGVSINAITGNENVMEKAKQARTEDEQADELDSIKLAVVDAVAKGIDGKVNKDNLNGALNGLIDGTVDGDAPWTVKGRTTKKEYTITESGQVEEAITITVEVKSFEDLNNKANLPSNKNTIVTKGTGDEQQQIVIPAGFKMATDTGETLETGMVIEDVGTLNGTEKQGNQFVWVPVNQKLVFKGQEETAGTIQLGRYDFGTKDEHKLEGPKNGNDVIMPYCTETSENSKAKDIEEFKTQTNKAKGYYIGRYEMGIEETLGKSKKVVCQLGKKVYNYITFDDAKQESQHLYNDVKKDTKTMYTSDLINSYAWDTAIVYIMKCTGVNDYAYQVDGQGSSAVETGTKDDEKCKINNMSNNVREWTTEKTGASYPCINRGGYYGNGRRQLYHTSILQRRIC